MKPFLLRNMFPFPFLVWPSGELFEAQGSRALTLDLSTLTLENNTAISIGKGKLIPSLMPREIVPFCQVSSSDTSIEGSSSFTFLRHF